MTRCDWCGWSYEDQRDEAGACMVHGPYGYGCSMYEQMDSDGESDEPIWCPRIDEAAELLEMMYAS